jgi:hypothetical protein
MTAVKPVDKIGDVYKNKVTGERVTVIEIRPTGVLRVAEGNGIRYYVDAEALLRYHEKVKSK